MKFLLLILLAGLSACSTTPESLDSLPLPTPATVCIECESLNEAYAQILTGRYQEALLSLESWDGDLEKPHGIRSSSLHSLAAGLFALENGDAAGAESEFQRIRDKDVRAALDAAISQTSELTSLTSY
jgi:hypothetical protein